MFGFGVGRRLWDVSWTRSRDEKLRKYVNAVAWQGYKGTPVPRDPSRGVSA